MSGARVSYEWNTAEVQAAIARLGGVLHAKVPRAIAAALVAVTEKRFDTGTEPFGARWKALLPAYAQIKRGPGILVASGMLRRSITSKVRGLTIAVGSNRIYAAVHQFGATIKPKRALALAFKLGGAGPRGGKGKRVFLVRAKSVTIPARPYLGFGPNDQREAWFVIQEAVERAVAG